MQNDTLIEVGIIDQMVLKTNVSDIVQKGKTNEKEIIFKRRTAVMKLPQVKRRRCRGI